MTGIREERKEATRQAIMAAAIALFSKKGYEGTSMTELARKAGVGKSTIYGYFPAKGDIFLAFCEDEVAYAFSELQRTHDPDAPLLEQMFALFMNQFHYVTRHRDFGRIIAREMIFPKELTHDRVKNLEEGYLAAMAGILRRAISRGELRDDLEFLFVSGHFYALYIIILSSWYDGRFTTIEEIEAALRKLLTQALQGLSPRSAAARE